MDVSARVYLIPNPRALIAATKDYSLTGMFPHKTFWKLGGIHIPAATSTLKQIYTCTLNTFGACMESCVQHSELTLLTWTWVFKWGKITWTAQQVKRIFRRDEWETVTPRSFICEFVFTLIHILDWWHVKCSCACCCPSRWVKGWKCLTEYNHSSVVQLGSKTRFCWNDMGWGQSRPGSPHYGGKPDSFIDSKIVATKWKQITDWNNRCGCINWVQCFYILFTFKADWGRTVSPLTEHELTSQRCLIKPPLMTPSKEN